LLAIVATSPSLAAANFIRGNKRKRDQQKRNPALRPIAPENIQGAHDLIAKPHTLERIMRNGLSTLKIRVKRRLSIWWHRPAVSF
jgi:hypothetical protein